MRLAIVVAMALLSVSAFAHPRRQSTTNSTNTTSNSGSGNADVGLSLQARMVCRRFNDVCESWVQANLLSDSNHIQDKYDALDECNSNWGKTSGCPEGILSLMNCAKGCVAVCQPNQSDQPADGNDDDDDDDDEEEEPVDEYDADEEEDESDSAAQQSIVGGGGARPTYNWTYVLQPQRAYIPEPLSYKKCLDKCPCLFKLRRRYPYIPI